MKKFVLSYSLLALGWLSSGAVITLPPYFSDNMVLQQGEDVVINGKSSRPGKKVTISPSWTKEKFTTQSDKNGDFSVSFSSPAPGASYTIRLDDGDARTLNNVACGEVWVCSGQSNMEMPVKGWGQVKNFEQELADGNHDNIRLLQLKRVVSQKPVDSFDMQLNGDGWAVCSPTSLENFSAVAYFYARELNNMLNVPIGVIDTSWGGTPCEAWTSIPTLKGVVDIDEHAAEIEECNGNLDALKAKYDNDVRNWQVALESSDPGMFGGQPVWAMQYHPEWKDMKLPGAFEYNGLPNYDGSVWFQLSVDIPDSWVNKDLVLNVGKIDDEDTTWFNGVQVGQGRDYWAQRTYTIPANAVTGNKALIAVKVQDNSGTGGICGEPEGLSLACGDEVISLAGNWKYHVGVPLAQQPKKPEYPESQNYPGNLYNAMIYPLKDFPVKGAIWYQGEANVDRWRQYTPLFQAMINDWRDTWNRDLPFYFVQLANFLERNEVQPESTWAHLREAQTNALKLDKTGMATAVDIGETYDIHPKNKQDVGARLAKAALAQTYNIGQYEMPWLDSMKVKGDKVILSFTQPLSQKGEGKPSFVICGADMIFHPANAVIDGNIITLSSDEVKHPVAARYGWADNPNCNIYNQSGLPLTPFRTDSYK
ncbi:MAG: 9-O-acetylesterase [Muribaculaceae bacterium]|nr:9-O-acetylesterase [Muribaculaceae bacterium]